MAAGIICQACGIEAPCKQIEFNQNIGALVIRFSRKYRGEMCKRCVHKYFWKTTGVNLTVGWLGYISLFIAPIFTIANLVRYIGAMGMKPVPPGASVPQLTDQAINKLAPLRGEIIQRLNANEPLAAVATDIAAKAGVTPGTVVKYVIALASAPKPPPLPKPTGGFPVVQPPPTPSVPVPVTPVSSIPVATEAPPRNPPPAPPELGLTS